MKMMTVLHAVHSHSEHLPSCAGCLHWQGADRNGRSRFESVAMLATCIDALGLNLSSVPRMTPTFVIPTRANCSTIWSRISRRCAMNRHGSDAVRTMPARITVLPAAVGATPEDATLAEDDLCPDVDDAALLVGALGELGGLENRGGKQL